MEEVKRQLKKNHHFVPQFYLRNFGSEKRIHIYNIKRKSVLGAVSIKDQCQRKYLYGKEQGVEDALGELESLASIAIRKIITENRPALSPQEHISLLVFIAFQWARTPLAVAMRMAHSSKFKEAIASWAPDDPRMGSWLSESNSDIDSLVLENLSMAAEIYPILADLKVKLVFNKSELGFITSDSPVVTFNQGAYGVKGTGTTSFGMKGIQIFLPISPQHLIMFYDHKYYRVESSKSGVVTIKDEKDVQQLNSLQAMAADENIFYSGDSLTETMLEKLPFEFRRPLSEIIKTHTLFSREKPNSMLVGIYSKSSEFKLTLSFMAVHKSIKRYPTTARGNAIRPAAMLLLGKNRPLGRVGKSTITKWISSRDHQRE